MKWLSLVLLCVFACPAFAGHHNGIRFNHNGHHNGVHFNSFSYSAPVQQLAVDPQSYPATQQFMLPQAGCTATQRLAVPGQQFMLPQAGCTATQRLAVPGYSGTQQFGVSRPSVVIVRTGLFGLRHHVVIQH